MIKTEKEIGGREATTSHTATPVVSGSLLLVPLTGEPTLISSSRDEGHFSMDSSGVYQVSPNGERLLVQGGNFTAGRPWMLSADNRLMFSLPTIGGRSLIGTKGGSPLPLVKVIDSTGGGVTDMIVGSILLGRDSPGGGTMVGWIDRPTVQQTYAGMYVWEGDVLRKFWAQTPGKPGSVFSPQATRKYVYFLIQEEGGPWVLSRYSRADGTTVVVKSGITPIDGEGFGGLHATEDSVAFIHKDTSGKYRFSRYNDGPRVTPTEECLIKDCSETISGVSLNESWGHAYEGTLTFIMKTSGGNALFQIKAGVGEMLIPPSVFPPGKPAGSISSAGRFYTMLSEGSIGRPLNRVYTLLKPELNLGSANQVRGELGKEVVLPCSDCPSLPSLTYEVNMAGKKVPATSNGREIRFTLPAEGLSAGVHDAVLSISGLELRFRLEVTETVSVVRPRLSGVTNMDNTQVTAMSPGQVVQVFGNALCPFPTSAPTPANIAPVTPWPTTLSGCRVRFRNEGSREWLYAPLQFAWTSSAGQMESQMNIQVPSSLELGPAEFVVESLDSAQTGVAKVSDPFKVTILEASPTFYTLRFDPRTGAFLGDNPYPIVLWNATRESWVFETDPVYPGDVLVAYLTGGGRTTPQIEDGLAGRGDMALPVKVTVGGIEAEILYAGTQGDYPGLYQINLQVSKETKVEGPTAELVFGIGAQERSFHINFSN